MRHSSGFKWLSTLLVGVLFLAMPNKAARAEPRAQWQRLPDVPVGVLAAAASVSGDSAVITGGITQIGLATNLVQVFNLKTRKWRMPPQQLNVARAEHAQVTLLDGRIFVVGGRRNVGKQRENGIATAEVFDPANGKSATVTPSLEQGAPAPTAHLLGDGRVIVVSGTTGAVFDPSSHAWGEPIDLHQARRDHTSILLPDGRVLVAGGLGRDSFEVIDVRERHSQLLSVRLPHVLDDLRLVQLSGLRAWVIGGQNTWGGNTTDHTWIVDMSDATHPTIERGPDLGLEQGLADHCVVELGPWAIVAGGESQQQRLDVELSDARLLDKRTLEVWSLPALHLPHDDAVAVATGRGVIVFGGAYQDQALLGRRMPIVGQCVEYYELPGDAFR